MVVDHALRRLMLEHIAELALGCEHCHFVCAMGMVWTYTVVGTPKPQHNRNRDDDPVFAPTVLTPLPGQEDECDHVCNKSQQLGTPPQVVCFELF